MRLRQTDGSPTFFQWVGSRMDNTDLAEAASRYALLHGLFEVWGHGRNREDAVRDAFKSGRFLQHAGDALWSLGVTYYGRSSLNKSEQQGLRRWFRGDVFVVIPEWSKDRVGEQRYPRPDHRGPLPTSRRKCTKRCPRTRSGRGRSRKEEREHALHLPRVASGG
ncbi:unnamed protein product [Ectocarpus fasciculatus]